MSRRSSTHAAVTEKRALHCARTVEIAEYLLAAGSRRQCARRQSSVDARAVPGPRGAGRGTAARRARRLVRHLHRGRAARCGSRRGRSSLGIAAMVRALLRHNPPIGVREPRYGGTPLDWCVHGSLHGWMKDTGDFATATALLLDAGETFEPAVLPTGRDDVDTVLRAYHRGPGPAGGNRRTMARCRRVASRRNRRVRRLARPAWHKWLSRRRETYRPSRRIVNLREHRLILRIVRLQSGEVRHVAVRPEQHIDARHHRDVVALATPTGVSICTITSMLSLIVSGN